MNGDELLRTRRSVRKFKDQKVEREVMADIVELARWAPSWGNYQIARYTLIEDKDIIDQLIEEGVDGFSYNMKTLKNAPNVAVLSYVQGKSGKIDYPEMKYDSGKTEMWEAFDTGIACQTFCLAAHEKGVATCIFGVVNSDAVKKIINLPEGETITSLIAYGYAETQPKPTARKEASDIMRFI